MAILRAFRAFDMRIIVREDGDTETDGGDIEIADGVWRTSFTGDFQATPTGYTGTLTGFAQTHDGRRVFEATGVEASADTALGIVDDRDNDRFLAYTLSGDDRILGSRRGDYLIGFGGDDRLQRRRRRRRALRRHRPRRRSRAAPATTSSPAARTPTGCSAASAPTPISSTTARDRVIEAAGAGRDTILSYVSTRIAADVERLVLIGDARIHARGGRGDDDLDGNEARNRLEGGGGRDRLDGDGGDDRSTAASAATP